MKMLLLIVVLLLILSSTTAQDYGEYARGAGVQRRNNRGPIIAAATTGVVGGILGSWITSRYLSKKYDKQKRELTDYLRLQEEINNQREKQWKQEYQKLYKSYEELHKETVERDYEEFKAPDTDNDDMISKQEFNTYVKKYLASFPELSEQDFPKFDDFDLDGDGKVSFDEWQQFLYDQKQQEQLKKGNNKKSSDPYQELLSALYDQTVQSDNFNSLQKQIGKNRGNRR